MKKAYATTSYFLNIAFKEMAVRIIPAKMPSNNVIRNLKSVFLANSENSPLNNNLNALKFNDFIEFIKRSNTPIINDTVPLETGITFTIPIAIPFKNIVSCCFIVILVVVVFENFHFNFYSINVRK